MATPLQESYLELFYCAARMRAGDVPAAKAAELRAWTEQQLLHSRERFRAQGLSQESIEDLELPLLALLDEAAQDSQNREFAEYWQPRSLQYERFGKAELGTKVFERLRQLRLQSDTPTATLEMYLFALLWGFEGQYRVDKMLAELQVLSEELQREIKARIPTAPPICESLLQPRRLPRPMPVLGAIRVVAIAALVLAVSGAAFLFFLNKEEVRSREAVKQATDHLQPVKLPHPQKPQEPSSKATKIPQPHRSHTKEHVQ